MADDDFTNAPQSIGELRAARTSKAQDWTVRDMLISILRRIDAGELKPVKGVLVMAMEAVGSDSEVVQVNSSKIFADYEALGLLAEASHSFLHKD